MTSASRAEIIAETPRNIATQQAMARWGVNVSNTLGNDNSRATEVEKLGDALYKVTLITNESVKLGNARQGEMTIRR